MKNIKSSGKLEQKLKEFSEEQRKTIFTNTGAIQLTEGCSIGCTDCGISALKGVQDYISPHLIKKISREYSQELQSNRMLYYASEPFDYDFEGHGYIDIHNAYKDNVRQGLSLITAIPKGKENLIFSIILDEQNRFTFNKTIGAISLTKFNYKRIERKLKESKILDNIEGVNDLKQFTRYLNRFDSQFVRDFVNEDERYNLSDNGNDLAEESIGCFHGVLIKPSGIYNVQIIKPEKEYPTGEIQTEITPDNFEVIPLTYYSPTIPNNLFLSLGDNERIN